MLLIFAVAGFCVTTYRLERFSVLRNADRELDLRIDAILSTIGGNRPPPPHERPPHDGDHRPPHGREGRPPGGNGPGPPPSWRGRTFDLSPVEKLFGPSDGGAFYYRVWRNPDDPGASSSLAPKEVPRPERDDGPVMEKRMRVREGYRECYTFTPPGDCLVVGRSTLAMEHDLRDFAWKLAGIGSGVILLGLAIGWWIASRALQPVAQISAAARRIADGHLAERIGTRDTESELGQLAGILDDTFRRLDATFDEQARFTSDAAHELRTPVSIILGQAQLALGRTRGPEEYRACIEICQRAARRMHGIIESLLQLSVLDAPDQPSDFAPADLAEFCREPVLLMRPLAEEKGITLHDALEPAPCVASAEGIARIVLNLLENAVKYGSADSEIRISTGTEGSDSVLRVSDTGPGIEARHLPHLFERFYRADSSRNRATGGAGLGLAICKRIAERHGGTIEVESAPDVGSVFTLRLPRTRMTGRETDLSRADG